MKLEKATELALELLIGGSSLRIDPLVKEDTVEAVIAISVEHVDLKQVEDILSKAERHEADFLIKDNVVIFR